MKHNMPLPYANTDNRIILGLFFFPHLNFYAEITINSMYVDLEHITLVSQIK